MAWCWTGENPSSETMVDKFTVLTHICITRPQRIKTQTQILCKCFLSNTYICLRFHEIHPYWYYWHQIFSQMLHTIYMIYNFHSVLTSSSCIHTHYISNTLQLVIPGQFNTKIRRIRIWPTLIKIIRPHYCWNGNLYITRIIIILQRTFELFHLSRRSLTIVFNTKITLN